MRSNRRTRKTNPTFAVVVDGDTEKWYLQMLNDNERQIRVKIKPEIPQKKSIEQQYNKVCELAQGEFDKVFWIVDFDTILKEDRETKKGNQKPSEKFIRYRNELLENENVVVIVNNPCLEYWFLLHYIKTTKTFSSCFDAEKELKKHIEGYEKTEKFFKKQNQDIYLKLKPYLSTALKNAKSLGDFDPQNLQKTMCEMELFFHSDELEKYFK